MANPVATLTKLLSSTTIEDHEEVLKATNAVLRTAKRDADALHTRVIALLKLDRYADALRALDEGGDALAAKCPFEKSYALYKMGDLEGAQEIFKSARETRALKHVAAQVAYRAERFEDASRIYAELSVQDAGVKGEENDLRINTLAVDAQLQWAGRGGLVPEERRQPSRDDVDAFETTYNAACSCIGRGELEKARVLLERARTLCEGLEELSDEEKRGEMLPIMVQLVFVYSKLGREEDAQVMQRMIDVEE
jgi:signal recognition particle subunit SRP72